MTPNQVQAAINDLCHVAGFIVLVDAPMAAHYVCSAQDMIWLTLGASISINDTADQYQTMLKPVLARLHALSKATLAEQQQARLVVLGQLHSAWEATQRAIEGEAWAVLPTLTDHPDHPADAKRLPPQLPVWDDSEAGQAMERWACLSLALWRLNVLCGCHPASIKESGQPPLPVPPSEISLGAPVPPETRSLTLRAWAIQPHSYAAHQAPPSRAKNRSGQFSALRAQAAELEARGLSWCIVAEVDGSPRSFAGGVYQNPTRSIVLAASPQSGYADHMPLLPTREGLAPWEQA